MQQRLMDYLYDELDAAEKQEVEQWLAENPEAQKELAALQQTRGFLAQLPSVKPAKPAPVISSSLRISRRWIPTISVAAAAAILLLLIATNVRVQVYQGGMSIAFGKAPAPTREVHEVNVAPSEEAIQTAIAVNNQEFHHQLDSIRQNLQQQLLVNQQHLQQDWQQRWQSRQASYEAQLKTIAKKEFQQKYPELAAMIQDMQLEQQQETRFLLNQLWNNWQQVRAEDLKAIEHNFVMLNQNLELNRQGTEELFKNIMVRSNTGE